MGDSSAARDVTAGGSSRLDRFAGWIVVLAVLAALGPAVVNGFSPIDDGPNITGNAHLTPPRFTADGVWWFWGHPHMSLYVPVTYTAWCVLGKATYVPTPDEEGNNFDPRVFHAASLLIHVIAAVTVFGLIRRLLEKTWPAVLGAILFGIHPVQVEAVAWTSGLKDVLCGCFGVLALYFYVRAAQNTRRATVFYAVATVAFVLSMLSKPSGVVIVLIAAAIDLGLLKRPMKRVVSSLALWALLAIPIVLIARGVQPAEVVAGLPLWQRPIVALGALGFYLWKLVWPATLTFDYAWRPAELMQHTSFYAVAAMPVVIGIVLVLGRRRCPALAIGGLVCALALLPMLGLVTFEFMFFSVVADHYAYVAMLGAALALAWGISASFDRKIGPPAAALCVVMLVGLGVRASFQTRIWRNERTLEDDMIASSPGGAMGHDLKGLYYEREAKQVLAIASFEKAAANLPAWQGPHEGLVRCYTATGQASKAIEELRTLIALAPPERRDNYLNWLGADGYRAVTERRFADAVLYFRALAEYRPEDAHVQQAVAEAERLAARAATQPVSGADARRARRNAAATKKSGQPD